MPDAFRFVFDEKRVFERAKSFESTNDGIVESLAGAGMCRLSVCRPYSACSELFAMLGKNVVAVDNYLNSGKKINATVSYNIPTKSTMQLTEKTDLFVDDIDDYVAASRRMLLLCSNEHSADTMVEMLGNEGIGAFKYLGILQEGKVAVASVGSDVVKQGFELIRSGFVMLTDYISLRPRDEQRRRRTTVKTSKGEKIMSYADLKIGDLVVHVNHGIGRYDGIQNLETQGVSRDYIKITYADGGKLYVPCDQLDLVSKYIGSEDTKLSKMGGAEWKRAKARAKASASNIAKELIKLYAERRNMKGYAFPIDDELQDEFEADFEYVETEGQLIADKDDYILASVRPKADYHHNRVVATLNLCRRQNESPA